MALRARPGSTRRRACVGVMVVCPTPGWSSGRPRSSVQQVGQKPGRAGLPDDDVDRAALAPLPWRAGWEVQVPDVEREHLGRPGGSLVQHPPQRPLAQADVLAVTSWPTSPTGRGASAVGPRLAPGQHPGEVGGEPTVPAASMPQAGPDGITSRRCMAPHHSRDCCRQFSGYAVNLYSVHVGRCTARDSL